MTFDWRNPDYLPIWRERARRLEWLREHPEMWGKIRLHYRNGHIDDLINDWGVTIDPRVTASGRRSLMPMLLWPKQREFIQFLWGNWRASKGGTCVKSRDVGISWLAMGFSTGVCTLFDDTSIGFGSEKEDKVDRSGDPDCLFYKGRLFVKHLPFELRGGWMLKTCSAHMRLFFPYTGSSITGEAGLNIGRGGRKTAWMIDESAHLPDPKAIDAAIVASTDCRFDLSSVKGMANSFAERAHNPDIPRFDFAMEDDPRRTPEYWAEKRRTVDPVIFAQEYGRDFSASVEGQVIPATWVASAVDAHVVLGLAPDGNRDAALDVADSGRDANAMAIGRTWLLEAVRMWKGSADLDIYHTVERAFTLCDEFGVPGFHYDADGLGAGVRGDARKLNEVRRENRGRVLTVQAFRGSGEVFEPENIFPGTDRTALDFFENLKAQSWWALRRRFQYTHRVIEAFKNGDRWEVDPTQFISIAKGFEHRARLCIELSQPVWAQSKRGKVMVDKVPVGTSTEVRNATASPNLADAVMMLYAPRYGNISIASGLLAATRAAQTALPLRR